MGVLHRSLFSRPLSVPGQVSRGGGPALNLFFSLSPLTPRRDLTPREPMKGFQARGRSTRVQVRHPCSTHDFGPLPGGSREKSSFSSPAGRGGRRGLEPREQPPAYPAGSPQPFPFLTPVSRRTLKQSRPRASLRVRKSKKTADGPSPSLACLAWLCFFFCRFSPEDPIEFLWPLMPSTPFFVSFLEGSPNRIVVSRPPMLGRHLFAFAPGLSAATLKRHFPTSRYGGIQMAPGAATNKKEK